MSEARALAGHHHDPLVKHQFEDIDQQRESATLGMWLFLAQEIMFFGGLFTAYAVYRASYPLAWLEGSSHLNLWIGTFNTTVLLCSSFTMALSVRAAMTGDQKRLVKNLLWTLLLGGSFLGIKVIEYHEKWTHGLVPGLHWNPGTTHADPGHLQLFYVLYFLMTGMHALHMVIGAAILIALIYFAKRGRFIRGDYMMVEGFGFYWHFVDIVWVYLFPLLYLIDRFHTLGGH